jgi:spore coat protein U-like protein
VQLVKAIFAFALLLCFSGAASAQSCNFSMTNVDFGSVSLTGGGNITTSGTFGATCSGTPGQTIEICANFGAGSGGSAAGGNPRYMTNGASQVEYSLLRPGGGRRVWGSYLWSYATRPPAITLTLGANGQGSLTRSVRGRMSTNQTSALPGLHTSTFSGSDATVDYGYAPGFACSAATSSRAQQVPFTAQINNTAACTVAATAMNFGNLTTMSAQRDATSTITVTCTRGTDYTLGLSNGSGGGTGPTARRMTNPGTTNFITYGIYRNAARNQPWGDIPGTNTESRRANGNAQNFTAYGRIPAQAEVRSFTYTDTIIATITY